MPRKVLVADDEPLTAEMLALMLAFNGYEVVCAHDGAEALRRAREIRPDVILMDVMMPELDGDEVTRVLRADPDLGDCPVVLFSSVDEEDIEWRAVGANVFLQKPLDIRRLPAVVDALLADTPPPEDRRVA